MTDPFAIGARQVALELGGQTQAVCADDALHLA
jgi:hypothetical protein